MRGRLVVAALLVSAPLAWTSPATAQPTQRSAVLQLDPEDAFGGSLGFDRGIAGVRQRLLELSTMASVLQVTAHPDDEQSGLLTYLSRGTGARTALLTLNRGEGGANVIGSEQFDALGLLRVEELLLADRYYGIDDQYFTSAADYGFSKVAAEAARSWDTTAVLRDMVRVIRQNRPVVVIARWHGSARDGHGQHQLAGALVPIAVAAAGDASRFPELQREGLSPWRVSRLFRANIAPGERADVTIDAGAFDPWLGERYASIGAEGLSRQRSQTSGRRQETDGASPQRLQLVAGAPLPDERDLFAGLPVGVADLGAMTGDSLGTEATDALRAFDAAARRALAEVDGRTPWEIVPTLLEARRSLVRANEAIAAGSRAVRALLSIKRLQVDRAITSAIGLRATSIVGSGQGDGRPLVPSDRAEVQLTVSHGSPLSIGVERAEVVVPAGWGAVHPSIEGGAASAREAWRRSLTLDVPPHAEPERPVYVRGSIAENEYRWREGRVAADVATLVRHPDALRARFTIRVEGEPLVLERALRYRRSDEPHGVVFPRAVVLPPISLRARPSVRIVRGDGEQRVGVSVEVAAHGGGPVEGEVSLVGDGVATLAAPQRVRLLPGERKTLAFDATLPANRDSLAFVATARVDAREWRDEVTVVDHAELEPAYHYATPTALVRRVAVEMSPGVKVGYVMGSGDLVPEAIAQLGATVTLLDATALSSGDFARFDVVMIGTRAYAVRPELAAATTALRDFARRGGSVVVLYQTQEFKPETMAPYAASLPDDAEEATEEDGAVRLVAPGHGQLTRPNRLTSADFAGWIEQRGSKFLTRMAPDYTPLIELHDTGQEPQRGVWVTAAVGEGRWSYVALALHRQLPYGVAGAYRILANLLTPARR